MPRIRILALSYYFPPMAEPRAIQVARLLEGLEADVVVLSGSADTPLHLGSSDASIAPDIDDHLAAVIRIPFHRPRLAQLADAAVLRCFGVRRTLPDIYRTWLKRVAPVLKERMPATPSPDLLVTFGSPMSDHLFGVAYKKQTGTPWIAHFSDPWVDDPYRKDPPLMRRFEGCLERRVIEHADAVLFTSPETLDLVMAKYPKSWLRRAFYLPHCYDPARYVPCLVPDPMAYIVRYVGSFYGRRSPRPLYAAIEEIAAQTPQLLEKVRFEIVGECLNGQGLASQYPTAARSIHVVGAVPYDESLRLMQTADCLLVIDAASDLSVFFPSKLVDYVGTRRFILALTPPGTSARVVSELGGVVVDPSSHEAVVATLRRVLKDRCDRSLLPADRYAKVLVQQEFMRIIERLMGTGANPVDRRQHVRATGS
jgi:glycosyltransferase involved in cell wall biosynthesis